MGKNISCEVFLIQMGIHNELKMDIKRFSVLKPLSPLCHLQGSLQIVSRKSVWHERTYFDTQE